MLSHESPEISICGAFFGGSSMMMTEDAKFALGF